MLFNSHEFILVFLPVAFLGFLVARRGVHTGTLWLVAASLCFYGWWNPVYLWLILASITVNYLIARWLEWRRAKLVLVAGIVFNLGLLAVFKYTDFGIEIANDALGLALPATNIVLPLAISFFTFQQVAYLVDTYEGLTVRHGFLDYALFVSFFPQLIAGPIVHQAEMLPQFQRIRERIDPTLIAEGLALFTIGLAKKVLIADQIAPFSTEVFDAALEPGARLTLFEAWSGALAYTFQIYFDFSGYCDMALGAARIFGVRLPVNFDSPYKAMSITDFWRRWHMTLSRFLRDYLYVPLGGNRFGTARMLRNIMIVMLLGGLWHGAAWTFVIWGGLHGIYLLVHRLWAGRRAHRQGGRAARAAGWALTFAAVVFAWVFFRAESLDAATAVLKGMVGVNGVALGLNHQTYLGSLASAIAAAGVEFVPVTLFSLWIVPWVAGCGLIAILLPNSQEWVIERRPVAGIAALAWRPTALVSAALGLAAALTIGSLSKASEFLYFNF